jgi:GT2 family glycosyltransferase
MSIGQEDGESSCRPSSADAVGIVLIGRNEGERLHRCLASTIGHGCKGVYVDSASTDGSAELARTMGAEVVELEETGFLTAARARNEGFQRLLEIQPDVRLVQFVDGDCELAKGWLERARALLEQRPEVAVVCGRLRERFPANSIYNRLASLEWDSPSGEIQACGGLAMIRAGVFQSVGGFNPAILAAEDDELCLRIRGRGWKVVRIDAEMAVHDMAMTRFGQWWSRSVRTGYAYAEGSAMHGRSPERHFVRQTRSASVWGILVPFLAVGLAWPTRGLGLLLLFGYLYLYHRTRRYYSLQRGMPPGDARLFATWIVIAKFPQAIGVIRYWTRRLSGHRTGAALHLGDLTTKGSMVG